MKNTKVFVVFLFTFFIGYVFVPSLKQETLSFESATKILQTSPTPAEIKPKFEILEENNDWEKDYDSKFTAKLLETGEGFHGDEVAAESGENWLGLFKENNKYFLRSTKIKIRRVNDPIVDESNEKTGKSVSVIGTNQPLFLIKNAKQLTAGEVNALFWMNINDLADDEYSDASSLNKNFVQEYDFDGRKYSLRVKSGLNKKGENIIALVLEGDGKTQVIHSLKSFEAGDYLGSVYLVGDLDHDNKPDFYFDLYIHDNVENNNLYLSSKAEKGKLVGKVAVFRSTGC